MPRIGTLPLAVLAAWGPPSRRPGGSMSPIERPRQYRGDRFSCSVPAPATGSRPLYAGHRQDHTQAASWLRARQHKRAFFPEDLRTSGFDAISLSLSTRRQRFTHVRLPVTHQTRFWRAFPRSLPTPALDRHDTAAVWALRLHGEPGGPTSITGTAALDQRSSTSSALHFQDTPQMVESMSKMKGASPVRHRPSRHGPAVHR